ncbi:MAG: type I DNA topoisomerase [Oscillospiraceae bacterium]|jgi:DNA topoisomerase-1|nr:type I DNA topoisomerase [Oscillospiraceae bacterium]
MAEKKNLVILESPAKAKTVEKYLGGEFTVTASMGHLRDLPESKFGVDIEAGYVPTYVPMKGKEATISSLKSLVKKSGSVYLATDPDREGEAIAWHLKEMLEIPDGKALRVTFNEITQKVVSEGIKSPRLLDMNLVDAQQARRVLDRIVGYQLSPLLWKKIRRGLSAGRVQSVTTKMVVDREREIRAFIPQEYWELDAVLMTADGADFTAHFYGNGAKQQELHSKEETDAVISAVTQAPFSVKDVKRGTRKRNPLPPFETSTLQQDASRKLNFNPRKTMSVAQELYESGMITYMRTDSLRISPDAQTSARSYAARRWGKDYIPEKPNAYKTKSGAQDAHEAIRPSDAALAPESSGLGGDKLRLYRLIWSRFMASQMSPALYDTFEIDAVSAGYVFRATESNLKFPGYLAAYDSDGDTGKKNKKPLPTELAAGNPLTLTELLPEQKFTQPPARYTEDSLIQAMKELGIGRPSTYAPTISVIENREYVVKEGKSLKPSPLGETVTQFLEEMFPSIVDVDFTANMETELDTVADGSRQWKAVLDDFYKGFEPKLKDAEEAPRYKVPVEETDEVCELCGKPMVIRSGRFGRFLSCSGFPDCTNARPITVTMPGQCPKCGGAILKREGKSKSNGRKYTLYVCEKGKSICDFSTFDVPTPDYCPECGKTLFKKSGKGAKKSFCINEECRLFVPEDARGGWVKKPDSAAAPTKSAKPTAKSTKPPSKRSSEK